MKRLFIILLILLGAFVSYGQTNGNFNNLDVRGRGRHYGPLYIYDTTYFKTTNANVPFLPASDPLGWFLTSQKATGKLVRVTMDMMVDTLTPFLAPTFSTTASNRNTLGWYSRKVGADLQFRGIKTGNTFIDLLDSTTYIQVTLDTADLFNNIPIQSQYWTFVDSATDTLKNNVSTAGVVAIKGNLEMQTTTATKGIIKQNGYRLLHTYTVDLNYPNIFVGHEAGNLTTVGKANVGIGYASLYALAGTGAPSYNTAIGYTSMSANTTGYNNTAIGARALGSNTTSTNNTAIGKDAMYSNKAGADGVAVGYEAMGNMNNSSTPFATYSTAIGYQSLLGSGTPANNTGMYNTAVGYKTMDAMTTASYNSVYGVDAGGALTTGDSNVLIGYSAGSQLTTESDKLFIENTNSATPLIWGDFRADSLRTNADVSFVKDLWYEDTFWDDALASGLSLKGGATAPTLRTFKGTIQQIAFQDATQNDEAFGQVQFSHRMKLSTDIDPHLHLALEDAPAAGDTVVFEIEYSWADLNEAYPNTTTQTILIPVSAWAALTHKYVDLTDLTGDGGDNVSSILTFRITRMQSSVHDTYDDWVFLLAIDFHYEVDSPGSRGETSK